MAFQGNDVSPEKKTGFTYKGREIILSKTRGAPMRGLAAKGIEKGIYPDEKRLEAATIFAATGNCETVQELTGVPATTVRNWRKEEWFRDILREIRDENNDKIDAIFSQIVEKAAKDVLERLENGDHKLTREGNIVRVPISAKDLSLVTAINVDKRQIIRGQPTSISGDSTKNLSVVEKLERLAQTFESLAKIGRKPEVIDVTDAQVVAEPSAPDHA